MKLNATMFKSGNLGKTLLCAWLIAVGATPLLGLGSAALSMIMHIVAIATGVLLWLDR